MSESEKDSDSEMNSIHQQSATDTSSEDEEEEDYWYEEVNDVEHIREIVEPLKTKKYRGLLKWLMSTFQDVSNDREDRLKSENLKGEIHGSFLFPQDDKMKILLKKPSTVNFLTFLNIQPPSADTENWKIPRNMSVEALDSKVDFIENIFFRGYPLQKVERLNRPLVGNFKKRQKLVNLVRCKECDISFRSLLQHLKKARKCSSAYDQNDMKDLREASKGLTKIRLRKYEEENKEYRKKQKADHYQANKSHRGVQMDEYYRKNWTKIAKKKAEYNLKNKEKIARKKAEKYKEERNVILKKKAEKYKEEKKSILKKKYPHIYGI